MNLGGWAPPSSSARFAFVLSSLYSAIHMYRVVVAPEKFLETIKEAGLNLFLLVQTIWLHMYNVHVFWGKYQVMSHSLGYGTVDCIQPILSAGLTWRCFLLQVLALYTAIFCSLQCIVSAYSSHWLLCILPPTEIFVGFDPTAYTVTEGVNSVTLAVVRTGNAGIPVTAAVTTLAGTAQGWATFVHVCDISVSQLMYGVIFANRFFRLWGCYDYSNLCTWRDTGVFWCQYS